MSIFYEIGEPVTLDLIMAKLGGVAGGSFGDLRASICMQFALCKWTQRNQFTTPRLTRPNTQISRSSHGRPKKRCLSLPSPGIFHSTLPTKIRVLAVMIFDHFISDL